MLRTHLRRGSLLIAGVLCLMSFLSAAASAAGPPTKVTAVNWNSGINFAEITGTANPNGAATTAKVEYRKSEGGAWTTAQSQSIGAGTETVNVGKMIVGLSSLTYYDFRISATNSYGTTYSAFDLHFTEKFRSFWGVYGQPKTHVVGVASEGTVTLNYKVGSVSIQTVCASHASGSLNHGEAGGDTFHVFWEGCVLTAGGGAPCNATFPIDFYVDAGFKPTVTSVPMPRCTEEANHLLVFPEAFRVQLPKGTWSVTQPGTMTMLAARDLAAPAVEISDSGSWYATGEDAGKKLGVF